MIGEERGVAKVVFQVMSDCCVAVVAVGNSLKVLTAPVSPGSVALSQVNCATPFTAQ